MKRLFQRNTRRGLIIGLLLITVKGLGQSPYSPSPPGTGSALEFNNAQSLIVTPTYRFAAQEFLISQANIIAQQLKLPEQLPITNQRIVYSHIAPPAMATARLGIGNVTTSNYAYYVGAGDILSSVVRTHLQDEYGQLLRRYYWPIERLDTNGAYQIATRLLSALPIDIDALNRDCTLIVEAFKPGGSDARKFVPIYWISWRKGPKPIVSLELFAPNETVRQLHIDDPAYVLRKPLSDIKVDFLISQTNKVKNE